VSLNEIIKEFLLEEGAIKVGFSNKETLAGGPPSIDLDYRLDGVECWMYQHGLRHMGEIELSRSFVGLAGMTS